MDKKIGIILWNENGVYSIQVNKSEMDVAEMFEDIIIPTLLAAGYTKESIDNYLDGIKTPDLP
jgi:hypothetical protein